MTVPLNGWKVLIPQEEGVEMKEEPEALDLDETEEEV